MSYSSERQIEEHNRRMQTDECYAEHTYDLERREAEDNDPEYQKLQTQWRQLQFEINQGINWFPHIRIDHTGYEERDVLGSMFRQLPPDGDDIPF